MCLPGKGITLIALVITIIVLLILAGITINLTVGQRGILTRAQEAGRNYQEAARKEDEDLAKFLGEADNIIAGTGGNNSSIESNYTMIDGVPVPKGFEHTEGNVEDGFVIKDNSGTETDGNEFVWVPCTEDGTNGSIKYDRYAFDNQQYTGEIDDATNSTKIKYSSSSPYYYTETMPSIELNSIKKYGGFYIGRYEVGIVGYDEEVDTRNSNNETNWTGWKNGTAVVQADKQVWNYITRDKAKEIAEGMYANNKAVESRLCSSYAWDTALKFIETNYPDYATNSTQGNYSNTTFEYTDLNGNTQTKASGSASSGVLVPTGQTTPVNNIYDMGGNVYEWTTEVCSYGAHPCSKRDGYYGATASSAPAGSRYSGSVHTSETNASVGTGFRSTLFVRL